MKVNVSKNVIPLMIMFLTLQSAESYASIDNYQSVVQDNSVANDPYFHISKKTITELTDEEALEFIQESDDEIVFTNGEKGANRLPQIPPRPPEINPGIKTDEELNKTGDAKADNASKGDSNEVTKQEPIKKEIPKKDPPKRTDVDIIRGSDLVASSGNGSTPGSSVVGALDSIFMVVDKIAAIGQKITPIIEKGRPVVTNNPMAAISVIPRFDTKDSVLHDMGGWSIPMTKHYKIAFSNGFGSEVVSFVYSITYQYGGNYKGAGKYLTGVRASARNLVVNWGFDLDANSTLVQISNIGTTANPVAGATVEISYTVKNWSRVNTTNEAFFIAGDGRLFKMD